MIRFADGSTAELCVALGGETRTGEELLRLSGLEIVSDTSGLGVRVCSIDGQGCPRKDCWCECRSLGPDCKYWAYHALENGSWRYSGLGAASRSVHHGDVDGWAWGAGTYGAGAEPPVRTFDELCPRDRSTPTERATRAPAATATRNPAPTATAPRPAPSKPAAVTATTRKPTRGPITSTPRPGEARPSTPSPLPSALDDSPARTPADSQPGTMQAAATSEATLGTGSSRAGASEGRGAGPRLTMTALAAGQDATRQAASAELATLVALAPELAPEAAGQLADRDSQSPDLARTLAPTLAVVKRQAGADARADAGYDTGAQGVIPGRWWIGGLAFAIIIGTLIVAGLYASRARG